MCSDGNVTISETFLQKSFYRSCKTENNKSSRWFMLNIKGRGLLGQGAGQRPVAPPSAHLSFCSGAPAAGERL